MDSDKEIEAINKKFINACCRASVMDMEIYLETGKVTQKSLVEGMRRALTYNNIEMVELLIKYKFDLDIYDGFLMAFAAMYSSLNIVKKIVECGMDPCAHYGYGLFNSVKNGDLDMVKFFVKNKVNVDHADGRALLLAIKLGDYETVELLINLGANVNIRNGRALRTANLSGDQQMIQLLFENGATTKKCNEIQKNLNINEKLIEAVIDEDFEMINDLLSKGADINFNNGYCLNIAIYNNNPELVEKLMKNNIKLNMRTGINKILLRPTDNEVTIINFLREYKINLLTDSWNEC